VILGEVVLFVEARELAGVVTYFAPCFVAEKRGVLCFELVAGSLQFAV